MSACSHQESCVSCSGAQQTVCDTCCCRSAVETVKIARETIEGLFNLQVGLAEETIQSLCAGIADCISGCVIHLSHAGIGLACLQHIPLGNSTLIT